MKDNSYESRKYILSAAVLLIFIIYISQLFSLQIKNEDYKSKADSNAFYKKTLYPSRGQMYDRNGKLLVYNKPAYDITFVPREIKGIDTLELCSTLGITLEEFTRRMERVKNRKYNPGYSQYTEQVFMTQIPIEDFAVFQEKNFLFKGFYVRKRYIRQYSHPVAGVLFGDVGEVSQRHIDRDAYYQQGDYIGTQGLEASYEKQLRGEKGTEVLLRDAHGRIQGKYNEGALDTPAIRGKNLTLSLDIELQMLGERLMQG
ncbi:MAG: penicillin-binding protein 2, partial [Bacteroidaceae bacterium]|nr:penicillin-binding protein 2 [Bacteroidaceae bacterium]